MKKLSERFNEFLRVKSIQFIITVSFVCITVLAVIVVGIILSGKFSRTAEQNVGMSTQKIIDQVSVNLDNYQKSMTSVSDTIEKGIKRTDSLPSKQLEEKMDVILDMRDDIVSMAIFTNKGELVMGNPFPSLKKQANVMSERWFKNALGSPDSSFISEPHVQNLFEVKHNWVLSFSKAISFQYKGKQEDGVLLIDMNFNSIEQLCGKSGLGKRGYIYVVDKEGNIIYHPNQQLVYTGLKSEDSNEVLSKTYGSFTQKLNGEERLLTVKSVGYTDWKVVGVSYMDELSATRKDITSFSVWILIFVIIFITLIFIFISAKVTKPIKLLDSSMKKVEEGDFNINIDIKGDKEVVHLSKTFNMMVFRIRQLMNQIVVEQEEKRKSELNALQAQINPHFLYNTLDSIVWMAENGNSKDVITMVTSLARLFRISISRGKNIITVKEEIEHARNYLIIQKVRYKTKFNFEIEAEEEVLQLKTLKLLLQPIIENSLYHGVQYMVEEGFIKISVKIEAGRLLYQVSDNGLGMKKEIVNNILSYNSTNTGGSGVGVKNVHQRIQLYYGKEYGVDIDSELEEGTTVKIWLPVVKDESQGKG